MESNLFYIDGILERERFRFKMLGNGNEMLNVEPDSGSDGGLTIGVTCRM